MLPERDQQFEQDIISEYGKEDGEKILKLVLRFREEQNYSIFDLFIDIKKLLGGQGDYLVLHGSGWTGAEWGDFQAIYLATDGIDEPIELYDTLEDKFYRISVIDFVESRPTRFKEADIWWKEKEFHCPYYELEHGAKEEK